MHSLTQKWMSFLFNRLSIAQRESGFIEQSISRRIWCSKNIWKHCRDSSRSMIKIISDFESYLEHSLSEIIIYLNMENVTSNHLTELLKLRNNNNKFFKNFMMILIIINEMLHFRTRVEDINEKEYTKTSPIL